MTSDVYAAEARERWPQQAAVSEQRLRGMTADDRSALFQRGHDITVELGARQAAGASVTDEDVQSLIGQHHAWVSEFWTPEHDAYVGLGQMYVQDPRFRATYDAVRPGLAQFICDAMAVWAEVHLPS